MRVLVVDDDADLVRSSAQLLGLTGHDARAALTGRDALAEAARFRPEVVLLDLTLPDLEGAEVARRLRADLGPGVVLLAVSGLDLAERPPTEPGLFDGHLVKPVVLKDLDRLLVDARADNPSGSRLGQGDRDG